MCIIPFTTITPYPTTNKIIFNNPINNKIILKTNCFEFNFLVSFKLKFYCQADLEEDPTMRQYVNIYKDTTKVPVDEDDDGEYEIYYYLDDAPGLLLVSCTLIKRYSQLAKITILPILPLSFIPLLLLNE